MLNYADMGNFAYFQHNTNQWNDWVTTNLTGGTKRLLVGGKTSWDIFDTDELNIAYPGFTAACDLLTDIGCDAHFVTEMLKFCITRADAVDLYTVNLDAVLTQPGRLERIKSALAIGLSGEELVPLLDNVATELPSTGLPNDLGFKSHI